MNDIEQKALALVNEVAKDRGVILNVYFDREITTHEALCRAIEQHEAFRQEVSDIVHAYIYADAGPDDWENLKSLVITKPDPLVEAVNEANAAGGEMTGQWIADFRAALDARGLEIREKGQ